MKTFDFNALFILLVVTLFLMMTQAKADTSNVKMAWDFRANEWVTLEFSRNKIEIYKTSEDVTDKVQIARTIFYIKDKIMVKKFKGVKYSRVTKIYYAFKGEQLMKFTTYAKGTPLWEKSAFTDQEQRVARKWVDKTEKFIDEYKSERWIEK